MKINLLAQQAARLLAVSTLSLSFASQAALVGRDLDGNLATFEAYYDTDQDITWLADANYAQTSNYDVDGLMTWSDANAWAATLNFGGVTGWRLPNTVDIGNDGCQYSTVGGTDCGYNVDTSTGEMASLFYDTLGNLAYYDTAGNGAQADWGLTNTGSFSNVQPSDYWSATEYVPFPSNAWLFFFGYGNQAYYYKTDSYYAWAVHSGDVGASVVPVPATAWLFGSALLGLVGLKRRT